ncbi:MAG TPA: hypothetical protein VE888_10855, partial [Streptosporangiaceae bacterium]|nr:hypothetical protein [Streptosporangiaceae bacterium]
MRARTARRVARWTAAGSVALTGAGLVLAYLDRLMRILQRADVVKVSTEDLAYLYPGQDAEAVAAELLAQGPA